MFERNLQELSSDEDRPYEEQLPKLLRSSIESRQMGILNDKATNSGNQKPKSPRAGDRRFQTRAETRASSLDNEVNVSSKDELFRLQLKLDR
jgi:hypothetical protein